MTEILDFNVREFDILALPEGERGKGKNECDGSDKGRGKLSYISHLNLLKNG
ncbi:MAG TPA: hypothetical protein VGN10_10345 [Pyrinomonadaceae bacterium]